MSEAKAKEQLAIDYIKNHARPLEKALYQYHFEGSSIDLLLAELAKFQNDDGGFGNGLEPDVRLKDSSVLATTIAFQNFRELGISFTEPIVQKASQYLLKTYDNHSRIWLIVPPNVDDAPHAPWWNFKDSPEHFWVNPRAEIVGYFYDYPDLFPRDLGQELTEELVTHLESLGESVEMHELLCYVRLAETKDLSANMKERLLRKLRLLVNANVVRDPADWGSYGLTPLSVVSSPASLFFTEFKDLIPSSLEHVKKYQSDEGYWSPTWSWDFVSKEGWQQAERDLRGIFTLGNLLLFKQFQEIR